MTDTRGFDECDAIKWTVCDLTKRTPVRVEADHRERTSGVIEALTAMPEVRVAICPLSTGDYRVDGRCVFERKTYADFAASVVDGRLFRQVTRLAATPGTSALVLEGLERDWETVGVAREALQGALISVEMVFGLPILRSSGPMETARLMLYAARQIQRMERGVVIRHERRPRKQRRLQLHVLQGLPGIGPQRAALLLEHFGSIAAAMQATEPQLMQVDGLGEVGARRIETLLHAQWERTAESAPPPP